MAEIKTKVHDGDVNSFIESFADTDQKKSDSYELLKIMSEASGFPPKMWGPSIIGFGMYHYKSERSKQEGDWMMVGFSPRKAAISLYVYTGAPGQDVHLDKLGKYKMGKGCIYAKKLADIDELTLRELIRSSVKYLQEKWN
ncbi:MAG: DUF1801 domain-containing protein [Pedobacter sp.]|nr:MAG: DUF1801 domain-containing protein [Pedobacter sp.]